ncbi:MAG: TRAP transporter substrate-binding protein [Thermincola sp.]|nr:TRAP transporter substrate-binding protein [Thermincola sp.]MDT3704224.1 TRAP transporter substrate-binding protein [Thermincola sp.]
MNFVKMRKKISWMIIMVLLFLGAVVLAGCSSAQPEKTSDAGKNAAEQKSGAEEKKDAEPKSNGGDKIVLRFGHNAVIDSPEHRGVEAFQKKLAELSGGKMEVQIYPNQQLGQMREQAEMVTMGSLEMTLQPTSVLSNFDNKLEVLDIPFLFTDPTQMFKALDGPAGAKLLASLEQAGMVGLNFQIAGMKQITANKVIKSPDDLKGLKMRTIPAPVIVKTYETLKANPTPIDYSELYNALQQKVVDGQENPPLAIEQQKFFEVQKALTVTNHGAFFYIPVASKKWFDKLPSDLQQNVRDAMAYASEIERKEVIDKEAAAIKRLGEKMEVYTPAAPEHEAFQKATEPVVEFVKGRVGAEIVDSFLK